MSEPVKPLPFFTGATLVVPFTTRECKPWPTLTGTVRPASPTEARAFYIKLQGVKADDAAGERKIRSAFYAEHIQTWNAGETVTAELVASLCNPLFEQLEDIVLGYTGLLGNS